ncbi:MAG: histone-like nucleoid-structuring protein Lsr2 [Candidatus Microbacterium stercoravium]
MAVKTFERVVDDLDGTELAPMSVESVSFGIDGEAFDIDLSSTNAAMLRDIFAPYAAAARVVSIGDREVGAYTRTVLPSAHAGTQIRRWAREHGYDVSPRGAIPREVRDAYARRED